MRRHDSGAPDWLTARPIAHRGLHDASEGAVENSLAAAKAAMARGYAMECDLRLSRDGRVFVFHDDALDRLTGEAGLFRERDAAEIERIFFRDSLQRILPLHGLLSVVESEIPLILELKSDFSGEVALAEAVAAELSGYAGPAAIKSFDPVLIAHLRARDAAWPLGIVAQDDYDEAGFATLAPQTRFGLRRFTHAAETRPDFLSWRAADLPNPTCEFARACARTPVMTWTIRSQDQAAGALKFADQIVFEGFSP